LGQIEVEMVAGGFRRTATSRFSQQAQRSLSLSLHVERVEVGLVPHRNGHDSSSCFICMPLSLRASSQNEASAMKEVKRFAISLSDPFDPKLVVNGT
jgi:hypothetical protein